MNQQALRNLVYLLSENDTNKIYRHLIAMSPKQRQELLKQVSWHRVFMQIYLKCKLHLANLPTPFIKGLEKRNQYLLRRGLLALEHLGELNTAFSQAGLDFILFKGLAVSTLIHQSPIMRNPKDMDILIRQQDIKKAHDILLGLGYRHYSPDLSPHDSRFKQYMKRQKDAVYLSNKADIAVEIHWRLDLNPHTLPTDFDVWWQNRQYINIGNNKIATFGLNDTLCHLATHGCISMWGRLCWLLDWWQITQNLTQQQHQTFIALAKKRNLHKMVNIADALCIKLFEPDSPRQNSVKLSALENAYVNLVLTYLGKMQYPPGYRRYLARISLKPGLAYKYSYIINSSKILFAKERNIREDQ